MLLWWADFDVSRVACSKPKVLDPPFSPASHFSEGGPYLTIMHLNRFVLFAFIGLAYSTFFR